MLTQRPLWNLLLPLTWWKWRLHLLVFQALVTSKREGITWSCWVRRQIFLVQNIWWVVWIHFFKPTAWADISKLLLTGSSRFNVRSVVLDWSYRLILSLVLVLLISKTTTTSQWISWRFYIVERPDRSYFIWLWSGPRSTFNLPLHIFVLHLWDVDFQQIDLVEERWALCMPFVVQKVFSQDRSKPVLLLTHFILLLRKLSNYHWFMVYLLLLFLAFEVILFRNVKNLHLQLLDVVVFLLVDPL